MQTSKEHFRTMADAKFDRGRVGVGGQTGCIMRNWKIENLLSSDDMDDVISRFFFTVVCVNNQLVNVIRRKSYRGLKIWIFFLYCSFYRPKICSIVHLVEKRMGLTIFQITIIPRTNFFLYGSS